MREITIVPSYYGNKYDLFTIKIPDDVENIKSYLDKAGIDYAYYSKESSPPVFIKK